MEDKGLEDLNLKPLEDRLATGEIKEVVLALNPDMDGEVMSRFLPTVAGSFAVK